MESRVDLPASFAMPLSLRGSVHGGQQPVAGASVQIYAAGTTGYGSGAVALMSAPVTTNQNGQFTLNANYSCPASTSQVYLVATGGNPGLSAGTNNPALAAMAALGPCRLVGSTYMLDPNAFINVDEVTTVAAVYALRAFLDPVTMQVGASSGNATGLANSFLVAHNLADPGTGQALAMVPAGTGKVPQAEINSLADSIAPCVNSDGTGSPCLSLFAASTPAGGMRAVNTIQALYNIASAPYSQVGAIYGLANSAAPYQPALSSAPNDWSIGIVYPQLSNAIAIDAGGNVWATSLPLGGPYAVFKLGPAGTNLSGPSGFTGSGLTNPSAISLDASGNAWITNSQTSSKAASVVELSNSGAPLSGPSGYQGGGMELLSSIANDGSGNAWIVSKAASGKASLIKLDPSGNVLSGASGFAFGTTSSTLGNNPGVAIDPSQSVWVADGSVVYKYGNAGDSISGAGGYSVGNLTPLGVAFDGHGNAWVNSPYVLGGLVPTTFGSLSPAGALLTPAAGYANCVRPASSGTTEYFCYFENPKTFALDGAGNIWSGVLFQTASRGRTISSSNYVSVLSPGGNVLSGPFGYTGGLAVTNFPNSDTIAVDGSGNVWDGGGGSLIELVGAATPVVAPFALGAQNGMLGQRP